LFLCSIHVTFIVLCCIVLALAIHSAYFIKRFSLLTAMMSNKLYLDLDLDLDRYLCIQHVRKILLEYLLTKQYSALLTRL